MPPHKSGIRYRSPSRLDRPAEWGRVAHEQKAVANRRKARAANALEPFEHLVCTHGCALHCRKIRVKSCKNCSRYFPLDAPNTRYCATCRHAIQTLQQHNRYHQRLDREPRYAPLACPQCRLLQDRLERLARHGKQETPTQEVSG